jgi:hypothetical protein
VVALGGTLAGGSAWVLVGTCSWSTDGGTDWRPGRGGLALALALALERLAGERQNQNSRGRKKSEDTRLRDTDERSRVAQTQQGGRLSRSWPNGRGLGT